MTRTIARGRNNSTGDVSYSRSCRTWCCYDPLGRDMTRDVEEVPLITAQPRKSHSQSLRLPPFWSDSGQSAGRWSP